MANPCDISEESAVLNDAILTTIITTETDAAVLDDAITHTLGVTTTDVALIGDESASRVSFTVTESAVIAGNLTNSPLTITSSTTETARIRDAITSKVADITNDAAIITDVVTARLTSFLIEVAGVHDSLLAPQVSSNLTTDTAVITDRLLQISSSLTTEVGVLDDAAFSRAIATSISTEVAQLASSLLGGAVVSNTTVEVGQLGDDAFSTLRAVTVTTEVAQLDDALLVAHAGIGWAAPTDSFAMSRYEAFPLASLAVIDGYLVGANDDGLFLLTGDTDQGAPIAAAIGGDLTDAIDGSDGPQSAAALRRPTYLHVGYATDGVLRFVLSETESGAEVAHTYDLPARLAAATVTNRVKLGRGLRSRFWRCRFENVAGSDFDINDGRIDFALLQRRA